MELEDTVAVIKPLHLMRGHRVFLGLPMAVTVSSATVVPVCQAQLHVLIRAAPTAHPRPSDCRFSVIGS